MKSVPTQFVFGLFCKATLLGNRYILLGVIAVRKAGELETMHWYKWLYISHEATEQLAKDGAKFEAVAG